LLEDTVLQKDIVGNERPVFVCNNTIIVADKIEFGIAILSDCIVSARLLKLIPYDFDKVLEDDEENVKLLVQSAFINVGETAEVAKHRMPSVIMHNCIIKLDEVYMDMDFDNVKGYLYLDDACIHRIGTMSDGIITKDVMIAMRTGFGSVTI